MKWSEKSEAATEKKGTTAKTDFDGERVWVTLEKYGKRSGQKNWDDLQAEYYHPHSKNTHEGNFTYRMTERMKTPK